MRGLHRRINLFFVNRIYAGTDPGTFERKRRLLNAVGFRLGEGTRVVGPIECTGTLSTGRDCWLGKNLRINGNGTVTIGDNCDIGPEVTFQTGGHRIGGSERRAGEGLVFHQRVGSGTWIGGRATILGDTEIGPGCVVAGCAAVTEDVGPDLLVGGVPARVIRRLDDGASERAAE